MSGIVFRSNSTPTPPPTPGDLTATYQFSSIGWTSFGLVAPEGAVPAGSGVKVGSLTTQTDVFATWPDGSMKHGMVTANITSIGSYVLSVITNPGGSYTPVWPTNTYAEFVDLISGLTYRATLPVFDGTDTWLNGNLCRESRVVIIPKTSGNVSHTRLNVFFDVRSYADGDYRVDAQLNNITNIASPDLLNYNLNIYVNNVLSYTKLNAFHGWQKRGRELLSANLTEAEVVPDFTPFYDSKIMVPFLSSIVVPSRPDVDTAPGFDLFDYGNYTLPMQQVGSRDEIGITPAWVSQYLVHKTQHLRKYMLRMADLSGSFSGHITDADGVTLISIDSYPNFWLDTRADAFPDGPIFRASDPTGTGSVQWRRPDGTLIAPEPLEIAHIPSATFYAYLITGDRWYLDQLKFYANYCLTHTTTYQNNRGYPSNSEGRMWSGNELRGAAWAIGLLASVSMILPDVDSGIVMPVGQTLAGYFRPKAVKNLEDLENYALADNGEGGPYGEVYPLNPLKVMWPYGRPWRYIDPSNPSAGIYTSIGVWQDAYMAATAWIGYRFGLISTKYQFYRLTKFWSDFFIDTYTLTVPVDPNGQPSIAYAMPYNIVAGIAPGPFVAPIDFTAFGTYEDMTFKNSGFLVPSGGPWQPAPAVIGYYGCESHWFAAWAAKEGLPGGSSALANINAFVYQGYTIADDYNGVYSGGGNNTRANFAIDFNRAYL